MTALGFLTVVCASAFLDGELWAGALVAALIGAVMMLVPTIARRPGR
ncbi:MAG: hypothetical protein IKF99_01170 [Oscillospiraceae bacterium]|nr:hypothetical protein [Oscillospiraceae bacterium]